MTNQEDEIARSRILSTAPKVSQLFVDEGLTVEEVFSVMIVLLSAAIKASGMSIDLATEGMKQALYELQRLSGENFSVHKEPEKMQ